MNSLVVDKMLDVRATDVNVTDDTLSVDLEDGRTVTVPLVWFPRLVHGTSQERANFEILPFGIHWEDLDEDISIRGLLLGEKSGENPQIIKWWLQQRAKGRRATVEDYMRERRKKLKPAKRQGRAANAHR